MVAARMKKKGIWI